MLDKQHQDYIYRAAKDSHFAPKQVPRPEHEGGFCSLQVRIYTGKSPFLSRSTFIACLVGMDIMFFKHEMHNFFFLHRFNITNDQKNYLWSSCYFDPGIIRDASGEDINVSRARTGKLNILKWHAEANMTTHG